MRISEVCDGVTLGDPGGYLLVISERSHFGKDRSDCVSFLIQGSSTLVLLTLGWIIFVVGSLLFLSGWLVLPLPSSTH